MTSTKTVPFDLGRTVPMETDRSAVTADLYWRIVEEGKAEYLVYCTIDGAPGEDWRRLTVFDKIREATEFVGKIHDWRRFPIATIEVDNANCFDEVL